MRKAWWNGGGSGIEVGIFLWLWLGIKRYCAKRSKVKFHVQGENENGKIIESKNRIITARMA